MVSGNSAPLCGRSRGSPITFNRAASDSNESERKRGPLLRFPTAEDK